MSIPEKQQRTTNHTIMDVLHGVVYEVVGGAGGLRRARWFPELADTPGNDVDAT